MAEKWQPSVADLIAVGAIVVAAVMWLNPPNWHWTLLIVVVVIGLVVLTALRHRSNPVRRAFAAISAIGILVWAAWNPMLASFKTDYPNFEFQWPVSFSSNTNQIVFPPEFTRDSCGGTLHRADGDLRFGGESGEGESICLINKADEIAVLAVCSVGSPCRVRGTVKDCDGSGECAKISKLKSIAKLDALLLPTNAPAWVRTAYQEQGQAEIPGPDENARIIEYFNTVRAKRNYRDDIDDWASAFVEWSLNKNGIIGPKADDPFHWLQWGQYLARPRFGCIVILSFSGLRHVGFFLREADQFILVLGGNQDDAVNIGRYKKSDVIAYRWPPTQK
jgi:uncharacterized protein (TIGR02594 family)